jgi:hypothetical protein
MYAIASGHGGRIESELHRARLAVDGRPRDVRQSVESQ